MSEEKYIGNIHDIFFKILKKSDGFSVGEKLTQIEKIAKKRFFNATDKEIYNAMEEYSKMPIEEEDTPFETEEEFITFVSGMLHTPRVFAVGIFHKNK